jgi:hypothetical protein
MAWGIIGPTKNNTPEVGRWAKFGDLPTGLIIYP